MVSSFRLAGLDKSIPRWLLPALAALAVLAIGHRALIPRGLPGPPGGDAPRQL